MSGVSDFTFFLFFFFLSPTREVFKAVFSGFLKWLKNRLLLVNDRPLRGDKSCECSICSCWHYFSPRSRTRCQYDAKKSMHVGCQYRNFKLRLLSVLMSNHTSIGYFSACFKIELSFPLCGVLFHKRRGSPSRLLTDVSFYIIWHQVCSPASRCVHSPLCGLASPVGSAALALDRQR